MIAAGAATSLITLYALTRFWNMAFWRRRDELEGYESVLLGSVQEAPEGATVTATRTTPVLMVAATTTLVVVTVLLTVFAGPLFEFTDRAAADLIDPTCTCRSSSPEASNDPATREISRWRSVWRQLPLLVALVALWLFLWDHIDTLTVVTGVILAIAVTRVLYLPPVLLSGRFNPWRGLLLGLRMMFDVVVASLQVALFALARSGSR